MALMTQSHSGDAAAVASDLPPGPDLPPDNQARLWMDAPCALLESCHARYGDIFTLRLGQFGTIVILAEPEAARQALTLDAEIYECRHFNASYRYAMGPQALFLQDGAAHRRIRPLVGRALRSDIIAGQAARIAVATRSALAGVRGPVTLRPLLHEITLSALLGLVFGEDEAARHAMLAAFRADAWRDLRAWKPWTAMSRMHPALREIIGGRVAARRAGPSRPSADLLGALAAARDAEGKPLASAEIEDQVLMLCITAGDAVAVACSWALIEMARHPAIQEALRAEILALGPDPDPGTAAALPLLTATVQEVLRLHTVLPTVSGRRLAVAADVGGRTYPPGVTLAPCEWLIHRRADLFDDPLHFRPARFLDRRYQDNHYFPFGGGARACLGTALAPLTMRVVLATALSMLRIAPLSPGAPKVVRHGTLLAPPEDWALAAEPLAPEPMSVS